MSFFSSFDEVAEGLAALSARWMSLLPPRAQSLVQLLLHLCSEDMRVFDSAALEYLMGMVYARDPTLLQAFARFEAAARNEGAGTDSEQSEEDDDDSFDEEDEASEHAYDSAEEEHKYTSAESSPKRRRAHHARKPSSGQASQALHGFVDSLEAILQAGSRAINELNQEENNGTRGY